MKKIILLIGLVGIVMMQFQNARAQYVTIPDSNFVAWLYSNGFDNCMVGNQLDTTCPDVTSEIFLSLNMLGIGDLTGVQYFDNLQSLGCSSNLLTWLPPLPSTLWQLNCNHNLLTSLPLLPDSLAHLSCNWNNLTELPVLPNTLQSLACVANQITALPALPASMNGLHCGYNQLTFLPALPNKLVELTCPNNLLINLPTLPDTLHLLMANNNQLTALPALPDTMSGLLLHNNPSLTCLPPLLVYTGSVDFFRIDSTAIECLLNDIQHSGYIPAIDTMPICSTSDPCYLLALCDAPTNSSANNVTSVSALIKWNMENDAVKYRVRVKNISTGVTNLYFVNVPDTTKSLINLSANTTYQVKVRSQCSTNGSILSPWSNTIPFTTSGATTCIYPTNISATPTSNSTATINWTPISGAAGYQLRYKQSTASSWNLIPINNGSTSSYNLTSLSPNTTYKYQLRTKCSISPLTWSNFSSIQTFTTPLRLGEAEIANQIHLYPNPSHGTVTFNSNDLVGTLYVYDIVGKKILHQVVSANEITLMDLPNGLLTYRFVSESGLVKTDKFVVIR